jgi:hypothetical protein
MVQAPWSMTRYKHVPVAGPIPHRQANIHARRTWRSGLLASGLSPTNLTKQQNLAPALPRSKLESTRSKGPPLRAVETPVTEIPVVGPNSLSDGDCLKWRRRRQGGQWVYQKWFVLVPISSSAAERGEFRPLHTPVHCTRYWIGGQQRRSRIPGVAASGDHASITSKTFTEEQERTGWNKEGFRCCSALLGIFNKTRCSGYKLTS